MYRTIIELKQGLSPEFEKDLREQIISAFNTSMGELKDVSSVSCQMIFEATAEEFSLIAAGIFFIDDHNLFSFFQKWDWEETESPEENHSLLDYYMSKKELRYVV